MQHERPACPLWRGCWGFSVFCCLVFALLTVSGSWAGTASQARCSGSCWRPMLLGTSTSRCLLPFCSAAAAEIPLGKRAGRSTLTCEGAGLLLPLCKSRKAGVGCEREHFTETSSSLRSPEAVKGSLRPHHQSCPLGSAGPVSCTALPTESCSITLGRQPTGAELPVLLFIFHSLSGQRGRRGTGSACSLRFP